MSVIMSNKNISNNGVKEAGTSCEGLSPGSLGMQGQVPGGCNQATTNKTSLNADNEDNVMVLGEEEWEIYLEIVWKLQALMGFHVNHQMKMILTLAATIRKDSHSQRH